MTWEGFCQWLTDISHNPVFISVVTVLSALASVLVVIAKTSVGRKALNELRRLGRDTGSQFIKVKKEVSDKLAEIDEKIKIEQHELAEFKSDLEKKTTIVYNQMAFVEETMFELLELIPNIKVKAKIEKLKIEWQSQKDKIAEVMGVSYSEIESKMSELDKRIAEIEALRDGTRNDNTSESKEI